MKTKTKIWLGVGAFVVAGVERRRGGDARPLASRTRLRPRADARAVADRYFAAAKKRLASGEHGEHGAPKKQGGERRRGRRGRRRKGRAKLPPDLDFALKIAQMRGHLLVGDELVKQGQWAAALPHFLHPSEELYGRSAAG